MNRVVAVNLDPSTLDVVTSVATDAELEVDVQAPDSLVTLDPATIEAVVLGDMSEAVQVVRRCQLSFPRAPVMVIVGEREWKTLTDAMRFSPYGVRGVHCIQADQRDRLRENIRVALDTQRRRKQHGKTIDALNRRLGEMPVATRTASALLGRLLTVAPIGVVIADPDGRIDEANARALRLLASDDRPFIGSFVWDSVDDRQAMRDLLGRSNGDPNAQPRVVLRRGELDLEVTAAKLAADAGGPGYLVLVQDVTERQQLLRDAQAASRAKDEFIAMLGHELRNPLAPVLTAAELLRMRQDPSLERECATISRHVHHMVQLIDDLLDVSRIAQGKLELRRQRIEIHAAITHGIEIASPLLEQHEHELVVDVPATGLHVDGDPTRLAQIFANLISNAAKYTHRGGTITVTAARVGEHIDVVVRDTGQGIAPETLPHIFDLFVQERQSLDRSRGGLGLGLAIVRSLTSLHGGTVSATSEVGRGSAFTVRLPVAATSEPATLAPTGPAAAGHRSRVLIIDDNADAAELLAELLNTLGYTVATALDGPSGIAEAARFAPDVVLLDIGLPVMDGFEVATLLRADPRFASTTLIAVTGYGHDHDRARTAAAGFSDHLTKPISLAMLQAAIERDHKPEDR